MGYWKTGTCTLTQGSAVVTGQGTNWLNSGLRKDDRLESNIGQVGTIASVDTPTQITLDKAWAGSSQAAAAYKGWYTPEDVFLEGKARQAFSMAGNGNLSALMELNGAGGNKLPYLTGANTMATTALSAGGRALVGLTGANGKIPVWTGPNAAAARDIVGTVTRAGGFPSGAIIESGINANGVYVRFADRTQVAWNPELNFEGTGPGIREMTWTFPAAFVNHSSLFGQVRRYSDSARFMGPRLNNPPGNTSASNLALEVTGGAGTGAIGVSLYAIGWWA